MSILLQGWEVTIGELASGNWRFVSSTLTCRFPFSLNSISTLSLSKHS